MSLQYQVESLEGLDESLHGYYEEADGVYRLAVDLGDRFVPAEQVAGLKANHDKLLAEKKTVAEREREAKEAARIAAQEKAMKDKDIESLTKSFKEREKELQNKFDELNNKISTQTRKSKALELAAKMADGPNAKLLSVFIEQRLKVDGTDIKIVDNDGNLTVSSEDDLIKEFSGNPDFKSLLRGTNASGGGATGSKHGDVGAKTITRQEFDDMQQHDRAAFFKAGGKVVD